MAIKDHFKVSDIAPLEPAPSSKKVWVNFLPNVDLGHILTMIGFAAAITVQWNVLDRRITVAEQVVKQQQEQAIETKGDMKDVKNTLARIQESLAVQAYITNQQRAGK